MKLSGTRVARRAFSPNINCSHMAGPAQRKQVLEVVVSRKSIGVDVMNVESASVLFWSLATLPAYAITFANLLLDLFPVWPIAEYLAAAPIAVERACERHHAAMLVGTGKAAEFLASYFIDSSKHDSPTRLASEFGPQSLLELMPTSVVTPDPMQAGQLLPTVPAFVHKEESRVSP